MKMRTDQNDKVPDDRIERFRLHLKARGHRESTARSYVTTAKHFLRWLTRGSNARKSLDRETVQIFLEKHLPVCRCVRGGQRGYKMGRAALNQLLSMEGQGRVRGVVAAEPHDISVSVQEFDRYLHEVCGLAEATRWYHCRHVREFLVWLSNNRSLAYDEIGPVTLICFVTERAKGYRPGSIGVLVYSLRSYVRFLAFQGKVSPSLATKIPRPPNWSLATLPPTLDAASLERFWAVFDRTSAIGRRDYAMARCFFDLGLRCCEVAAMKLDAIDWHTGTLRLPRNKSRQEEVLPIPEPLGRALIAYLQKGRPATDSRAVFVHHRAPRGHTVQVTTVRGAIRRAFARAGLPWTGTHVFRHTMATRLLQHGTSIKEIADVLRHRSLNTTQIYTKVDLGQLSLVAMPWPRRSS
jgi:site-specific recombinase XerD